MPTTMARTKTYRMMPAALKLCKWAGLWHDTDPHKLCRPALTTMLGLIFWYVLPGIGFVLHRRERPIAPVMKAAIEVVGMVSFCLRIGLNVRNRAILQRCYRELNEVFNEFVNSMNEEVQNMLERLQRPTERLTVLYFCGILVGISMYGGVAGLIAIFKTVFGWEEVDLPATFMEADFIILDHRSNFLYWLPVYFISLTVYVKLAIAMIGQEAFCWNLMYHMAYLLKIVQIEVAQLDGCENPHLFKAKLKNAVRIHNICFSNILRLEKALNDTLMLLYGLSVCNTCFAMVIVALVTDVKIFIMMGFVLCYLIFLIFSFSMLGTELTTTSLAIADTVYNLRWYERSIEEQRCLLFVLMRSQRICGITVGKFMFVSRASFAEAIKSAFSYFTIMHQLYGN